MKPWANGGLATAVALLMAELLCWWFHGGAFPYLNIFEEDARYGVVLEARATTRVRTRTGHRSSISTNSLGFRGPEPRAGEGATLLLGDSQVLGFGVEEEESMAGWLRASGHPAQAIAVPSWGPHELALAAEDFVPRLAPRDVVFFANLANDWPEANVANAERSTARDGWLSRRRFDDAEVDGWTFPGRRSLFGRSQLVFTVRALGRLSSGLQTADGTLGASAALRMLEHATELSAPRAGSRSRITPFVRAVRTACGNRCRVLVAILPMDVQVDESAWAKYRTAPRDLSPLEPLREDLEEDLAELGVVAVNVFDALRAASPGAFLDDDPHLSASGHRVVARAIEAELRPSGETAGLEPRP